jgi:hypothetical protein
MALRGIKIKDGEDLSPSNIQRVIQALEADKPVTKKEACSMLKIAYNTTRLNKIIEDFKDKEAIAIKRRKAVRNTPVSDMDKKEIVEDYLSGSSISQIAESVYRSPSVVKNILNQYNIPIRNKAYTYRNPVFLQEDSDAEDYSKGDLVFSARYNSPAYIDKLVDTNDIHGNVYRIWILGDHAQFAVQPFYELADLRRIQKELGIKITELDHDEIMMLIIEGLQKAKKLKKER